MKKQSKNSRPKRGADGLYHTQVCIGHYPDGKRCYKRFSGKNWTDMQLEVLLAKKNFESEPVPKEHDKRALTLDEAFSKYIDTCRVLCEEGGDYSYSTIPAYESIRKHAFQDFINKPVNEITVDDIQTYLDTAVSKRTGQRKSGKTLKNEYYLLKPVLEKYAPDINLSKIKLAKKKRRRKMVMRMADAPEILKAAHSMHPEFFAYVLFTMVMGMRPSETYALTWGDISAEPQLAIVDGQKYTYGTVSISKATVMNEFRTYSTKGTKTEAGTRTLQHDWSFFETLYAAIPRGKDEERILKMNPRQEQYYWDKLRDSMELDEGMRFYDLRHYHCSVMVASGAPEDYIAADMGHSTIQMAHDVYIELIEEKKQDINLSVCKYTAELMRDFNFATQTATKPATKPQLSLMAAR